MSSGAMTESGSNSSGMLLRLAAFGLLSALIVALPWTTTLLIHPVDRATAAALVRVLPFTGLRAHAVGATVTLYRGSETRCLEIGAGCDGIFALLLLLSGMFAVPVGWRRRLRWLPAALLFTFLMNQCRLVLLAWVATFVTDPGVFRFYHLYGGQLFGIVSIYFFWLFWLNRVLAPAEGVHAAGAVSVAAVEGASGAEG